MPKNPGLEYNSALPPFLQRIKASNAALDGRHNVQIPRARGNAGVGGRLQMNGGESGEDEPVIVDQDGNVVGREEAMAEVEDRGEEGVDGNGRDEVRKERNVNVTSGFARKRKALKAVSGIEEGDPQVVENRDDEDDDSGPVKSLKKSTKDLQGIVAKGKKNAEKQVAEDKDRINAAGKKGKRKKIKLSFDEPE